MTAAAVTQRQEEARRYALLIFAIIQVCHVSSAIIGVIVGAVVNATRCNSIISAVSLPIWLIAMAVGNFVTDLLFLLFEHVYHGNRESKGHAGTVPVGDWFFCCCVGIPVTLFFICTTVFQIAWFVVGVIVLATVDQTCDSLLYAFSVLSMIVTPISISVARLAVWKTAL